MVRLYRPVTALHTVQYHSLQVQYSPVCVCVCVCVYVCDVYVCVGCVGVYVRVNEK